MNAPERIRAAWYAPDDAEMPKNLSALTPASRFWDIDSHLVEYVRADLIPATPLSAAMAVPEVRPDVPAHIVEYTNWRGETARRVIIPIRMWWGSTEWHPQEQWMLTAWDVEKDAVRDFAWQDMRPVQNGATSAALAALRAVEGQ